MNAIDSIEIIKNREDLFPVSPDEAPYVLVCNAHGETAPATSLREALDMRDWPTEWCEDCLHAEIVAEGM